jgi:hypothetical protein
MPVMRLLMASDAGDTASQEPKYSHPRMRCERTEHKRRTVMKKWIALGAAAALFTGMTIANAQTSSTPGAGSPGQDQSGTTASGSASTPGTPKTKDQPPSARPNGAGTMAPSSK